MPVRILVIDDHPFTRDVIVDWLSPCYQVTALAHSDEAIDHLADYDALVCDVFLEGRDGYEIAALARDRKPAIGIVLITSHDADEVEPGRIPKHAAILYKPLRRQDLLAAIERHLPRGR